MLTGLLLAFITALSEASKDIFFSCQEMRRLSSLLKATVLTLLAIPILGIVVLVNGKADIQPEFWFYVSIQAVLLSAATLLYMRALALGSVAQTQPILALSSVLLLITNPIMTDDHVPLIGWVGVLLITVSIYATQLPDDLSGQSFLQSFTQPFRELLFQPGVRSKLGVALIYSVTANLDKLCIQASDGPTYLFIHSILISVLFLSFIAFRVKKNAEASSALYRFELWRKAAPGGIIHSFTILFHVWALAWTTVPYVIAMKRLSILFVSLWGYYVRKDRKPTWYRLLATCFIVVGVGIIVLHG